MMRRPIIYQAIMACFQPELGQWPLPDCQSVRAHAACGLQPFLRRGAETS